MDQYNQTVIRSQSEINQPEQPVRNYLKEIEPENEDAVLSGYGETVLVVEDEESILKPFSVSALALKIREALDT